MLSVAGEALGFTRIVEVKAAEEPHIIVEPFVQAILSVPQAETKSFERREVVFPVPPDKTEALRLVLYYADVYGVSRVLATDIVACESGFNSLADNPVSTAFGLYQFLDSSWVSVQRELNMTLNRYSADDQARAGAFWLSTRGTNPWLASKHCWS